MNGWGNGRGHFLNREIKTRDTLVGNDELSLVNIGGFHSHDLILGHKDRPEFGGANLVPVRASVEPRGESRSQTDLDVLLQYEVWQTRFGNHECGGRFFHIADVKGATGHQECTNQVQEFQCVLHFISSSAR